MSRCPNILGRFQIFASSLIYLTQIVSTILWRLNDESDESAKARQLKPQILLLDNLGLMLFEQLGEEYPDILGSIIANVVGMPQMNSPAKDLCESTSSSQEKSNDQIISSQ